MDPFIKLSSQLQEQVKQINVSLGSSSGISDLARTILLHYKPLSISEALYTSTLPGFQMPETYTNNFAFKDLSHSLYEIAKLNPSISEKLSNFAASQIALSSELSNFAKVFNQTHLQEFNSLSIAIQIASKNFLKTIEVNRNWDDIVIAENVNDVISNETQKVIDSESVTLNDLNSLKISIIDELTSILSKTKSEKARLFIFDLITIIGLLLSLYSTYQQENSKTTQEVIWDDLLRLFVPIIIGTRVANLSKKVNPKNLVQGHFKSFFWGVVA